ncbi:MAG: penicillin-binding protein 2 [Kiritimatiellae bacterium]|nr:penicillin-binding protein 2 [Kiritimatiellia bacterium]
MESYGQKITDSWRMALLALMFTAGAAFLAVSLHRVQVERFSVLSHDQLRQSVRRVQVPGPRGLIFDRNGELLAGNRASYCIAYYVEELRKRGRWQNTIDAVDADIDRLAKELGIPRVISKKAVADHVMQSLPMPLLAWRDVEQETLARWAEAVEPFPGVDIYVQPERSYPNNTLAAHVLGYVGRDRPQPLPGHKVHFYLPEMIGKGGIEGRYNKVLTGMSGGQLIRVDARGYKHAVWEGEAAVPGKDIHLTLDIKVQAALEKVLSGWRGAGVVIDPRNGEVLALASSPVYDPNDFVPVMPSGVWKRLNEDEAVPLINRAIQGWYAPGSTFKPVTAMAAFLSGKFDPAEEYVCDGAFVLGTMRLRCWNTYGHGSISLRKAIEQSCNSYFCHIAHSIGYDSIYEVARMLGLGQPSGIDLPAESGGLLPTAKWKQDRMRDLWRPGDTCQIGIGQGLLITTPLQMAVVTSVFANRGSLYRPHLARQAIAPLEREMGWPAQAVAAVREGMRDVAEVGTGRRVQVRGLSVAAKTGTAEVDTAGVRRKNTWVTAFAPFDSPTAAVAIMVENGESGGLTVAPMVREVLVSIFGEEPAAEGEGIPGARDFTADMEVRGD